MKSEYIKGFSGIDVLVLNYEHGYSTGIRFEDNEIILVELDYSYGKSIKIPLEDWEEFKKFIDSQIHMKGS